MGVAREVLWLMLEFSICLKPTSWSYPHLPPNRHALSRATIDRRRIRPCPLAQMFAAFGTSSPGCTLTPDLASDSAKCSGFHSPFPYS